MTLKEAILDWHNKYSAYYSSQVYQLSKIEQSFKIVSKLLEKKIIDKITLKQFISLVGEIADIL